MTATWNDGDVTWNDVGFSWQGVDLGYVIPPPAITRVRQYGYPIRDRMNQGWVDETAAATELWESLNEAPGSASDYARAPAPADSQVYCAKITPLRDPDVQGQHYVRYWYSKTAASGYDVNLVVQLREGYQHERSPGTLLVEWEHDDIDETVTRVEQLLTAEETDRITNYADLYMRFVFTQV